MSFFKKILKSIFGESQKVKDDLFGEMNDTGDCFECMRKFASSKKEVEIIIDYEGEGITGKQKEFFLKIENVYEDLCLKFNTYIEEAAKEWMPDYITKDFQKEFDLEFIRIPLCKKEPYKWTIAFYADNEIAHTCTFTMKGMEIIDLMIDG